MARPKSIVTLPLTQESVRRLFDYDPETGILSNLVARSAQTKIGSPAGSIDKRGYCIIRVCGKSFKSHRLAWLHFYGSWPEGELDHIDGVRSNNRIRNLRDCIHAKNARNRGDHSNNSSGVKGVYLVRPGRSKQWMACITAGSKKYHLGFFETLEEAAAVRAKASLELNAEFAPERCRNG